jgi:sterol desaturase/sphingolipid hydroxylase (fatty acid hydroxylase superfamily)
MIEWLADAFAAAQGALFEGAVQPLLMAVGGMEFQEAGFEACEWFLAGLIEVCLLYALLRPLEAWRPAEAWGDRRGVGTDVIYTLLHRLGGVALLAFFLLTPLTDAAEGWLRLNGWQRWELDEIWPGVTTIAWVGFLLYLAVLDFADYWYHRLQHRYRWWWALHAVHHSQRKMTLWSDNRNHLLDDLLRDVFFAALACIIGVEPGQFLALVIVSRMTESLQHANVRMSFGRWGQYILISPRFHRRHHAMGFGHEGTARGCNFGVLLPWWDMLFGTADLSPGSPVTGIRDQLRGRDYGETFWRQQWLGMKRLFGRA